MKSVNKTILVGHLGQDPEIKQLEGGRTLVRINVATSERWRDQETGETKERTEWHRVVAFGKTAEAVGEYLSKGSLVFVEGRLQNRKWKDKDGNDRTSTEVVADQVTFLDRKAVEPAGKAVEPAGKAVASKSRSTSRAA